MPDTTSAGLHLSNVSLSPASSRCLWPGRAALGWPEYLGKIVLRSWVDSGWFKIALFIAQTCLYKSNININNIPSKMSCCPKWPPFWSSPPSCHRSSITLSTNFSVLSITKWLQVQIQHDSMHCSCIVDEWGWIHRWPSERIIGHRLPPRKV